MLLPEYTNAFKKDLKLAEKRGKDLSKLKAILALLVEEKPLPERNRDHVLSGNYKDYRECHIEPDWLLIYLIVDKSILKLVRTGTHSDLF